ncbi:hypothetical protein BVX98_05310 [bacterium F11]|nr:hypothetical protein BVX98_05310 [bacterium F11]
MILLLIFSVLITIVASYFAIQNAIPISVHFLYWNYDGSLAVVLLTSMGLGVVAALLMMLPVVIRQRWTIRYLKTKAKEESVKNEKSIAGREEENKEELELAGRFE